MNIADARNPSVGRNAQHEKLTPEIRLQSAMNACESLLKREDLTDEAKAVYTTLKTILEGVKAGTKDFSSENIKEVLNSIIGTTKNFTLNADGVTVTFSDRTINDLILPQSPSVGMYHQDIDGSEFKWGDTVKTDQGLQAPNVWSKDEATKLNAQQECLTALKNAGLEPLPQGTTVSGALSDVNVKYPQNIDKTRFAFSELEFLSFIKEKPSQALLDKAIDALSAKDLSSIAGKVLPDQEGFSSMEELLEAVKLRLHTMDFSQLPWEVTSRMDKNEISELSNRRLNELDDNKFNNFTGGLKKDDFSHDGQSFKINLSMYNGECTFKKEDGKTTKYTWDAGFNPAEYSAQINRESNTFSGDVRIYKLEPGTVLVRVFGKGQSVKASCWCRADDSNSSVTCAKDLYEKLAVKAEWNGDGNLGIFIVPEGADIWVAEGKIAAQAEKYTGKTNVNGKDVQGKHTFLYEGGGTQLNILTPNAPSQGTSFAGVEPQIFNQCMFCFRNDNMI